MTPATTTRKAATEGQLPVLRGAMVFAWADAGALQRLAVGEFARFDWVALLPPAIAANGKPPWIPRGAELHAMLAGEVAYTWSDPR